MPTETPGQETFSLWTVVHIVFDHLVEHGMHPTFGEAGDPSAPAATLLQALGVCPAAKSDTRMPDDVRAELAALRHAMFDEP